MLDRKQIAEDISAHHLNLAHKEVRQALEALDMVAYSDPQPGTPELTISQLTDAVMGRVAPHVLRACEEAIEVDRDEPGDAI